MQDQELLNEVIEAIKQNLVDISAERQRDVVKYTFKLNNSSMKGFGGGGVKLELKCDSAPQQSSSNANKTVSKPAEPVKQEPKKEEPKKPEPKKEEPPPKKEEQANDEEDDDDDDSKYLQFEPKSSNDSKKADNKDKPKEEPKKEEPAKEESKDEEAHKMHEQSDNEEAAAPILAAAKPMTASDVKSASKSKGKKRKKKATIDETESKDSAPAKTNASKAVFGTLKTGRERRTHASTADTFNGCEYIPNFKGSERGCVLKKSNDELTKQGIIAKSQIESINRADISGEPLKKIKKLIGEYAKLGKPYSTTFSIPSIELSTVDLTFTGPFCPNVKFVSDYEGNNYIIKDIPDIDDNNYLLNKAELKPGYKLLKVKGQSVNNKPFADTKKILDKAGKDVRVNYSVTFIEGKYSWYNFTTPYNDDEKKIDLPIPDSLYPRYTQTQHSYLKISYYMIIWTKVWMEFTRC